MVACTAVGARAHRETISVTWGSWATMPGSPSGWHSSPASRRTYCGSTRHAGSLLDGHDRSGRSRARHDSNASRLLRAQIGACAPRCASSDHLRRAPGSADRFIAAGRVTPELADQLGLCGLAGRASGMSWDCACSFRPFPTTRWTCVATHRSGMAARVTVRFDEVMESLELCSVILTGCRAATSVPICPHLSMEAQAWAGWRLARWCS